MAYNTKLHFGPIVRIRNLTDENALSPLYNHDMEDRLADVNPSNLEEDDDEAHEYFIPNIVGYNFVYDSSYGDVLEEFNPMKLERWMRAFRTDFKKEIALLKKYHGAANVTVFTGFISGSD